MRQASAPGDCQSGCASQLPEAAIRAASYTGAVTPTAEIKPAPRASTYLLASRKSRPAVLAYLDSHAYIDIFRIVFDVSDIPATWHTAIARWKADWVCGHATTISSHDEAVIPPD